MADNKIDKLLRACEIVKAQDEHETELVKLVATAMQTGYELGKLTEKGE